MVVIVLIVMVVVVMVVIVFDCNVGGSDCVNCGDGGSDVSGGDCGDGGGSAATLFCQEMGRREY